MINWWIVPNLAKNQKTGVGGLMIVLVSNYVADMTLSGAYIFITSSIFDSFLLGGEGSTAYLFADVCCSTVYM